MVLSALFWLAWSPIGLPGAEAGTGSQAAACLVAAQAAASAAAAASGPGVSAAWACSHSPPARTISVEQKLQIEINYFFCFTHVITEI